jgi:hypothetical protein
MKLIKKSEVVFAEDSLQKQFDELKEKDKFKINRRYNKICLAH